MAIIMFFPLQDTSPARSPVRTLHSHRDGDRNPHETEETRSFKASNFLFFPLQLRQNRCKAETRRQFTGAHSPLAVLTESFDRTAAKSTANRRIQDSQSVSFSGTVLTRTIMTL